MNRVCQRKSARSRRGVVTAFACAIAIGGAAFACGDDASSDNPGGATTPTDEAAGSDASQTAKDARADDDQSALGIDGATKDAGPAPTSTGTTVWARAFGSPGLSQVEQVAFDESDNLLVAGEFTGAATDFGCPTKLDSNVPGGGPGFNPHSLFVAKYALNGDCIWASNIGRSNGDRLQGLAVDAAGDAWVALYITAVPSDYKSVLVRLASATGTEKWSRTFAGPAGTSVEAGPVSVLTDGTVALSGSIRAKNAGSSIDFGDGKTVVMTASPDDHRPFMLSVTPGATAATAKDVLVFPPVNNTYVIAGTRHPSGDMVLGGIFFKSITYPMAPQGSPVTVTVAAGTGGGLNQAPWMARVKSSGLVVVHKELTIPNQSMGYGGTASAPDGTIVIAASYSGSNVSLEGEPLPNGGSGNLVVLKTDALGTKTWVKGFASDGNEGANAVAVDVWGRVLVVGPHGSGALDFGNGTGALPSTSNLTSYVAKLDDKGQAIYAHHLGADGELGVFTVAAAPSSGRVAIGGYYKGTATFSGGKTLPAPPDGGVTLSGAGFVLVTEP